MAADTEGARTVYVKGFASLSQFMASDPIDHSATIFRRFERLSARNLLYMQSELAVMQARLEKHDEQDLSATIEEKGYLRDWEIFESRAKAMSAREKERKKLVEDIRPKLKEYSATHNMSSQHTQTVKADSISEEALLLEAQILSLRRPSKQSYEAFYAIFWNKDGRNSECPTLEGHSRSLYDDRDDLVALFRVQEEDRLTAFFRTKLGRLFKDPKRRQAHDTRIFQISLRRVNVIVGLINIAFAAGLLFGAILNLYYVKSETKRLGLVSGYTVAFALCVALLTNARRAEIFGACAAYAAVLVVYVGSGIGGN